MLEKNIRRRISSDDKQQRFEGYHQHCYTMNNLFNRRNGESGKLIPSQNADSVASDYQIDKSNSKKLIIIGVIIIIIIIVSAVGSSFLLRSKITLDDDEDDITIVPDPEVPPPPSWNKLKTFKGRGAVCAGDKLCAEIGKSILEKGGSAVDAAIAASLCSGMSNMQNIGIGGASLMTIYERATGKAYYLNARERAPLAAHPDMFSNKSLTDSFIGPLAIAVPGEIAAYWMAHQRFGKLSWSELFDDSIALCRNGWQLSKSQYDDLFKNQERILTDPTMRSMFVDETNQFKLPGSWIKPKKLCDTFEIIAQKGAAEFYNGSLGRTMIEDLRKQGSILTMEDLNRYSATWEEPLVSELPDGMKLYTVDFPASGALLIFILNVLNEFKLNGDSLKGVNNTITTYHIIIEAFKYAFALRTTMGDPEYSDMSEIRRILISKDYARHIKSAIDEKRTWNDPKHYQADDTLLEDHGTSHLSVISPDGDAVSMTGTLNTFFGSGVVSERTGILLNSGMDDFSIPSIVNYFGVPAGNKKNLIERGKRPLSSMVPSIVVGSDNNIRMVIGSAGGTKITTSTAFVMARYIWMNETIKEAVDAPRIHHQLFPMKLEYQFGVTKPVVQGLEELGHKTSRYRGRGSIVCALIQTDNVVYGIADYRRAGDVSGIN